MSTQPWRKGKVIKIEDYKPATKRFWIQLPELEKFDFTPGQFVTLDLPIHEIPERRWRNYSIASWPDGSNVFELIIILLPGGAGTTYLFNEVKVGTEIGVKGAQGIFVLPPKIDRDIFLICTGTGLAPFRGMVNHIHNQKIPFGNIYLIFGCRTRENLLYFEELKALQDKTPGFHYIPTLSREDWADRKGYVHHVYEELCRDKQPAHFYLCGWHNMMEDAKKTITGLGYDKNVIHQEFFLTEESSN